MYSRALSPENTKIRPTTAIAGNDKSAKDKKFVVQSFSEHEVFCAGVPKFQTPATMTLYNQLFHALESLALLLVLILIFFLKVKVFSTFLRDARSFVT